MCNCKCIEKSLEIQPLKQRSTVEREMKVSTEVKIPLFTIWISMLFVILAWLCIAFENLKPIKGRIIGPHLCKFHIKR